MSKDFAIIETGGKQYKVLSGDTLQVEKLGNGRAAAHDPIVFEKVLLRTVGGRVDIGAPYVAGAKVEATLLGQTRGEKKIVFKYHSKTRYRKKKGHRQDYSTVRIV